jgi:hypothetical protein
VPKIIGVGGLQVLAVIVPGSPLRPHFAGPSYVRRGSESIIASEEQFAELISSRNSKSSMILSFKGKPVRVINRYHRPMGTIDESHWGKTPVIVSCNEWWVTLQEDAGARHIFPLQQVTLSFDEGIRSLLLYVDR